ncbi:MAG TPA: RNA polymerase sigma-70 factor [Actinomycetota bacterium]|nr:RNA polymerase sigma-70 factor [Actinomycetota bacterium]
MDEGDAHQELRPLLFSIAYRMVGSASEAEDLVQEAYLRFHRAVSGGAVVESPKAYLSAVTTRLAIDHLRSARARRERYVGAWLPEPLVTGEEPDPAGHAETADSLSLAFLVLLERLSPVQRAVFLLHEVFGYGYAEIAGLVGRSEDNCRQIAARARRHVEAGRPRFEASRRQREELARRFFAAVDQGDTEGLVGLLAADAVFHGDGGGKAPALTAPLHGAERIARFLLGLARRGRTVGMRFAPAEINGHPGLLAFDPAGGLVSVLALDIADSRVQTVRSIVNPDKLRHLGPVGDLNALLGNG